MAEDIDEEWGEGNDPLSADYIQGQADRPRVKREEVKGDILATLEARQRAYRMVFGNADSDAVQLVLADLKVFCRGEKSTFDIDERVHCLITGRQEVYARIQMHTKLTLDALIAELN